MTTSAMSGARQVLAELVWYRGQVSEHKGQDSVTVTFDRARWRNAQDAVEDLLRHTLFSSADSTLIDLTRLVTRPRKLTGAGHHRVRVTFREADWSAARRALADLVALKVVTIRHGPKGPPITEGRLSIYDADDQLVAQLPPNDPTFAVTDEVTHWLSADELERLARRYGYGS